MTALSDALTAAQRSALAALEKAYVAEWNEGDVADDAAEAFRWGFTPDAREPEDSGREQ